MMAKKTADQLFDEAPEVGAQTADELFSAAPEAPAPAPETSALEALQSFGRGVGQGGTSGFGDELSGVMSAAREMSARHPVATAAVSQLAPMVSPMLAVPALFAQLGEGGSLADGSQDFSDESTRDALLKSYLQGRNSDRKSNAEAAARAPGSFFAGNLAGSVLTPNPVKGMGFMKGVQQGAALGAANAAGMSDSLASLPGDALAGGVVGGAGGALLSGVGEAITPTVNGLSRKAERLAVKTFGPIKSKVGDLIAEDQLQEAGRWALEKKVPKVGGRAGETENLIQAGDNTRNVYERGLPEYKNKLNELGQSKKALDAAGTEVDLGTTEGALRKDAARFKALPVLENQKASAILDEAADLIGRERSAAEQAIQAAKDAHAERVAASQGAYQKAMAQREKSIARAIAERTKEEAAAAKVSAKEAEELLPSMLEDNAIRSGKGDAYTNLMVFGRRSPKPIALPPPKVEPIQLVDEVPLRPAEVPPLDLSKFKSPEQAARVPLSKAEEIKSRLGQSYRDAVTQRRINPGSIPKATIEAKDIPRQLLKRQNEEAAMATQAAEQAKGNTDFKWGERFIDAKKEVRKFKTLNEIATRKLAGEEANQIFGVGDTMTGSAAGVAASASGAAVLPAVIAGGAINNLARSRGYSTLAVGADRLAKTINRIPAGARNAAYGNAIPSAMKAVSSGVNSARADDFEEEQRRAAAAAFTAAQGQGQGQ